MGQAWRRWGSAIWLVALLWGCAAETAIYCEAKGCDDGNPCTQDKCVPSQGCQHSNLDSGTCNDGDTCTSGEMCKAGLCAGGTPISCGDGNPCTSETCNPAKGCVMAAIEGTCDDGNLCTLGDLCKSGACGYLEVKDCSDGNPCTADSCNPTGGCVSLAIDATCSDGNACTSGDACKAGVCEAAGTVQCDDGNPCSADGCNSEIGCTHQAALGSPCDDGNACTLSDSCTATAQCQGGQAVNCDDGEVCTGDACDLASGCTHTELNAACTDGNACTAGDVCSGGTCTAGAPLGCNDGNPCSEDTCIEMTGCNHEANWAPCDDGQPCTKGDQCSNYTCKAGPLAQCDDKNPCTSDACNPQTGDCGHLPQPGLACDDDNTCTTGDVCSTQGSCAGTGKNCSDGDLCTKDQCSAGVCSNIPFSESFCDDGKQCTVDTCEWKLGCQHTLATDAPCDDGNKCTQGEKCKANGSCVGTTITCNDNNPCTGDSCDPKSGCKHTSEFIVAACEDGNPCTTKDSCLNGKCLGGAAPNCDDGNVCTADFCEPLVGCKHSPVAEWTTCSSDPAFICTNKGTCSGSLFAKWVAVIPAGKSAFGCSPKDFLCRPDENPLHIAEISTYYLHMLEVSVKQYKDCVNAGACENFKSLKPDCNFTLGKLDHPMDCVNRTEAAAYCAWQGMRLPTEHEWERAARGDCGSLTDSACKAAATIHPWGNTVPSCNEDAVFAYNDNKGCGSGNTWSVGAGALSPFGIPSLAGNVAEWVLDIYSASAYTNASAKDPKNTVGTNGIARGGSYASAFIDVRTSARVELPLLSSDRGLGFRCARSVGAKP
jgi:formylglycine-generating enzyme required for sulfatase activity